MEGKEKKKKKTKLLQLPLSSYLFQLFYCTPKGKRQVRDFRKLHIIANHAYVAIYSTRPQWGTAPQSKQAPSSSPCNENPPPFSTENRSPYQ